MSKKWGFQQTGHAVSEKPGFESQNGHFSVFWAKKLFVSAKQCFGHRKCAFVGQNVRLAVKTSCFEQEKILSKFQILSAKNSFFDQKAPFLSQNPIFFRQNVVFLSQEVFS